MLYTQELDATNIAVVKERYKHVFTNPLTPLNFLKRSELVYPDKAAIVDKDKTYTWKQFADKVYRLANGLKAYGIEKDDRVAIMSRNNSDFLVALYGIGMAGAVSVLVNFRMAAPEVKYVLNHSECKAAIVDDSFAETVRAVMPELETTKLFLDIPDSESANQPLGIEFDRFLEQASSEPVEVPVTDELDMLCVVYTSGTTGTPKGCVHTHRGTYLNALAEVIEARMNADSAYLWTLPMFHCEGWCFVWAVTAVGAKHICLDAVRAETIYKLIEEEHVTNMCGAPTVYLTIANYMKEHNLKFSQKIRGLIGGAAPTPAIIRDTEAIGIELTQVYGLTEVYGPYTLCEWQKEWDNLPLKERAVLKARQGVPLVTYTPVRVADDDGNDVPHDGQTQGEILMQGNNVMLWYLNGLREIDEAFKDGWFHSGDGAVVHPNGYIEIVDRIKDIIVTGGENVSSIEVEKVIAEHPAVADVAVYAKPDSKWGEIVKALIQLKAGKTVTEEEMAQWCRQSLSRFKVPREIEFGEVKRTPTGKVQKNLLKRSESQPIML